MAMLRSINDGDYVYYSVIITILYDFWVVKQMLCDENNDCDILF